MKNRDGLAEGGRTGGTLAKDIADKFPNHVKITKISPNRIFAAVDRLAWLQVATFMKESLGFEHVTSVGGVDWPDQNLMQVVYHITSYANRVTAEMIVDVPRDSPEVDSIALLWGGANWHERETFDMFGIIFKGHPKLERILTPDGTDYFPYRKDFVGGRRI